MKILQRKHSLRIACKQRRTDEVEALNEPGSIDRLLHACFNFNPETVSLAELTEYIVNTHHEYVKNELPTIMGQLLKIASRHGELYPEMIVVAKLFDELKSEFQLHMQKEESILFPRIKELEEKQLSGQLVNVDIPFLKSPILLMEHDHKQSGSVMAVIRKLTDNYTPPKGACSTYKLALATLETFQIDLDRHVHLENNILFPRALKLLDADS
jgi:regulator of cell morphogenesis and NO signaling